MKFAIAGATGLIGSALVQRLHGEGHQLVLLVRDPQRARRLFPAARFPQAQIIAYQPLQSGDWQQAIAGCDGVVNLAGAPIAEGRWTPERKQEIRDSRAIGTQRIVEAIAAANPKPAVLVNSSAIGYYGTSETACFVESDRPGQDFLAQVCQAWEAAAQTVTAQGTRLVILRTGLVLAEGGVLGKMIPAFRAFAGGPLGTGNQWFSWVALADMVSLIVTALTDPRYTGVYNATAPNPVRLAEFCHLLGDQLHRPSWLPVPSFALELLLGEMAKVVVEGQQVRPERAIAAGFTFRYPTAAAALAAVLST